MRLDCGIDIGSTNLKVVLVEPDGRVAFVRSVAAPRVSDGVGAVTDAAALVSLLEELIIAGWRQCGAREPLRSITAAGVGEDGLGIRADLTPTGPAIPWFDTRASDDAAALRSRNDVSARTGIAIAADRTVAKWGWLRRNRPQELQEARHWIALTDYPAVWWSGQPFMSLSLAPRTACFDIFDRQWVEPLLEAVGAPRLPAVLAAGTALGGVRAGPLVQSGCATSTTVVAVGGHDHPVAASLFARNDPSGIVDSLGTANLLYGELQPSGLRPRPECLALSIPPAGGPRLACLGVLELGSALAAQRRQDEAFWSFLAHSRLPSGPPADAAELETEQPDEPALRRTLERVTLRARDLLQAMLESGVAPGEIYTCGGWSRSRGFAELRASVFGRPVNVVDDLEMTAIGAALYGAKAAGAADFNPLRPSDIKRVDPVADWVPHYDKLFHDLRRGTMAGSPAR